MNGMTSLSKLFDKKIFRIPDYQRGYAWQYSQLSDFWDDLWNLSEGRYHYTGMLSLKKLKPNEYSLWSEEKWLIEQNAYEAYHVVDGQQRLTTFVILVNAIVQLAEKNGIEYLNNNALSEIKARYIVEYQRPKMILKAYKFGYEQDNPSFSFLRYNILGEGASGNLQETFYTLNLEQAKNFFDKRVWELYELYGEDGIQILFGKLVNRLHFNVHYIEDDFDVYVAFETMNNRGKKLSNLEILKNRLIYLTTIFPNGTLLNAEKEQMRKDINEAWSEVYFELGRNKNKPLNDDEYLKNHWILYFKYSRRRGDDYIKFLLDECFTSKKVYGVKTGFEGLAGENFEEDSLFDESYEEESEEILNFEDDVLYPKEIIEYVKSLKETAKFWYYSHNPGESSYTSEEKKWLDKLNRLGMNYFRPLIVASFINDTVSAEERVRLFKSIEKFVFLCFRMARYSSNYLSSEIYKKARELMWKEVEISKVIAYIDEKFEANIPEATDTFRAKMESAFKTKDGFYDWYDLKYCLFEYEASLSEKKIIVHLNDWANFVKNEKDRISIEHIFPQMPSKWYWRNQFRGYSETEQHSLANSLGNLLPLSQCINSSLQNDEFERKKNGTNKRERGYCHGSHSEQEVAMYADWTPKAILERGLHLLGFMENRWGFQFRDDEMRLNVLGLGFMKEQREIPPELPVPQEAEAAEVDIKSEQESLKDRRFRYWKMALEKIHQMHGDKSFSGVNPCPYDTIHGFFGIGGCSIYCTANKAGTNVGIVIGTKDRARNSALFDAAFAHKEEIEERLGGSISWWRNDEGKYAWIYYNRSDICIINENDWSNMAHFHAEWSKKLYDEVVPYLKDFKTLEG